MGRILVGTDGSEAAHAALEEAIALARRLRSSVLLVCVAELPRWSLSPSQELQATRAWAERLLAEESLRAPDDVAIETLSAVGRPAMMLAALADEEDIDLVVVGTHGRGATSQPLLGSVPLRLMLVCRKPVVVVPSGAGLQPGLRKPDLASAGVWSESVMEVHDEDEDEQERENGFPPLGVE